MRASLRLMMTAMMLIVCGLGTFGGGIALGIHGEDVGLWLLAVGAFMMGLGFAALDIADLFSPPPESPDE